MTFESFQELFRKATTTEPFPYQQSFATSPTLHELVHAPTGAGKTATTILGWAWRYFGTKTPTPRRLVYCLPMRVLVEQTREVAEQWMKRLALPVAVHVLMGGEETVEWDLCPEKPAILIGTQDMLLSRALNRGYGMKSRYRWPMHFALLNNDCLWVMDEVQLMGNGLATTAQLAAFGCKLWQRALPCHFVWMSATLGESFLDTRDRRDWGIVQGSKLELSDADRADLRLKKRLRAAKSIRIVNAVPKTTEMLNGHMSHAVGRLSLIILNTVPAAMKVYAELEKELRKPAAKKKGRLPSIGLLHGRFRPIDRQRQLKSVTEFASQIDKETGAVPDSAGFLLVSTQVVEAGFDISSVRLWSEIAPWPSDVQRLGRLNREGLQPNAMATFWMPKSDKERENSKDSPNAKRIGPYERPALETGRTLLGAVVAELEAGTHYRDSLEKVLQTEESKSSLQLAADSVIRPNDFYELFSTEPDLAGGFTNVSQFVRDCDRNVDVQVFWRDFAPEGPNKLEQSRPKRDELCPVPFFEFRRFLGDKAVAWEWNSEKNAKRGQRQGVGAWEPRRAADVQPGMTLLLAQSEGGYSVDLGWTGIHDDKPTLLDGTADLEDGLNRDPDSSTEQWCLLSHHLSDVGAEADCLLRSLGLNNSGQAEAVALAARWHDWGKSLDRWQKAVSRFTEKIRSQLEQIRKNAALSHFHRIVEEWFPKWSPPKADLQQWAKFPDVREVLNHQSLSKEARIQLRRNLNAAFSPGMRHEAASALAAWDAWLRGDAHLSALAVYLIASHHGKVRTALRSTQADDDVFGLTTADSLRPVPGFFERDASLSFDAKHIGAHGEWNESGSSFQMTSPSWAQVVAELLGPIETVEEPIDPAIPSREPHNLGPFVLTYLETILRVADARASQEPGKGKRP